LRMPLALYLTEDREIRLDVDPEAWTKAFENALAHGEVVQVQETSGRTLSINPQQVLYWVTEGSGAVEARSHDQPVPA
jgi:hypothetical protein